MEDRLVPASLAVFDNGTYVDTVGGLSSESDNIQASLTSLGHTVSTFTGLTAADFTTALAGKDALVIPELEVGDLNAALSPAARTAIANFVAGGGGLIINGQIGSRDEALLNAVFGFSLAAGTNYASGEPFAITANAAGTEFAGGPTPIPGNNGTYAHTKASQPVGSKSIYENATDTVVTLTSYGSGQIAFLGFDWFNADPVGSQDGGWLQVLDSAVEQVSVGPTPPSNVSITGGSVNENGTFNLNGSFTDPNGGDTHTVTVKWGPGEGTTTVTLPVGARTFSIGHQYLDDKPSGSSFNVYPIEVVVSDTGATTVSSATVTSLTGDVTNADFNNAFSPTIGPVLADHLTFTTTGYAHSHSGIINVFVEVHNPTTNTWTTVFSNTISSGGQFNFNGLNVTFAPQLVDAVRLTSSPGQNQTFHSWGNLSLLVAGSPATTTVTVNNVAPTNIVLGANSVIENGTVTLTGSFHDDGTQDTHTLVINWNALGNVGGPGEGTTTLTTAGPNPAGTTLSYLGNGNWSFSATHKYLDDNPTITSSDVYTIKATITDDDTGTNSATTTTSVNNVAPMLGCVTHIYELNGSFADSLGGPSMVTAGGSLGATGYTFGAGQGPNLSNAITSSTYSIEMFFSIDSTSGYVRLIDFKNLNSDNGLYNLDTALNFYNYTTGAAGAFVAGQPVHVVVTRDGSSNQFIGYVDGVQQISFTDTLLDGTFTGLNNIIHFLRDDLIVAGEEASGFLDYVRIYDCVLSPADVSDLAAGGSPSGLNVSASAIDENDSVTLTGDFADPGTLDVHTVTINWGEGAPEVHVLPVGDRSFSFSHTYLDDNPSATNSDVYPITVTVSDDDSGSDTASTSVTVNNLDPTLTDLSATPILENGTTTLSGTIADVGTEDTFTVDIDWDGDNVYDETQTGVGAGTFNFTHQYLDDDPTGTAVDNMPINVRVTDDDTGDVTGSTTVEVTNVTPTMSLTVGGMTSIAPAHIYELNGSLADQLGGPSLVDDGGVLGATRYTFGANQGLTLTGALADTENYSVVIQMEFDDTTPYWKKILDFEERSLDLGLYIEDNFLTLFPGTAGTDTVSANTDFWVVLTRNSATGETKTYLNGVLQQTYTGPDSDLAIPSTNVLTFFKDDFETATFESQGGSVDCIATYDGVLTDADVAALFAAQECVSSGTNVIDENGVATLSGVFHDDGTLDTHTIVIDWNTAGNLGGPGEGTTTLTTAGPNPVGTTLSYLGNGNWSFSATHQYLDDNATGDSSNVYTVGVTITDDDTSVGTNSTTVTVNNVDPVLDSLSATSSVDEDGTVHLTGTYHDVGTQDTHELTIDWGEGALETYVVTGGAFDITHQYLDDNPTGTASDVYDIDVILTDDDSGTDTASTSTTITNVAPVITTVSLSSTSIDEGSSTTLTIDWNDPGTQDTYTVTINWGDDSDPTILTITPSVDVIPVGASATGSSTLSVTHVYADDGSSPGNGTLSDVSTISVVVEDDDLGSDSATIDVTVNNVAPTLSAVTGVPLTDDPDECNTTWVVTGKFSDPGTDSYQFEINWGDGNIDTFNVPGPGFPGAAGFVAVDVQGSASHTYAAFGIYTITVTVTDDDGGTTSAVVGVVAVEASAEIVNDPVWGLMLDIHGTDFDDDITVNQSMENGVPVFKVHANSWATERTFAAAGVNIVSIHLCEGDDHAVISSGVDVPSILFGDEGNDHLNAGKLGAIVLGGDGDDMLIGGNGKDILIGGKGADRIVGNSGDDLLIAGYTAYDANEAALKGLSALWNTGASYASRVAAVQNNISNPYYFNTDGPTQTVFSDDDVDQLTGSSGSDLFLADTTLDESGAVKDIITDLKNETALDIDLS